MNKPKVLTMLLVIIVSLIYSLAQEVMAHPSKYNEINPYHECERVADVWDDRSSTYSVVAIDSATEHNGVWYCIVLGEKHMPEYNMPVHLKMVYVKKTGRLIVKKWGF